MRQSIYRSVALPSCPTLGAAGGVELMYVVGCSPLAVSPAQLFLVVVQCMGVAVEQGSCKQCDLLPHSRSRAGDIGGKVGCTAQEQQCILYILK